MIMVYIRLLAELLAFLSFINGVLSTGTSRFLTFELGTGNMEKLKRTFSTLLTSHIILAHFYCILSRNGGTWFIIINGHTS